MENPSYVEVSFYVGGKNLDLEHFTREIQILPSETRDINDYPSIIKNGENIPEELRPRYVWSICEKEELCKDILSPISRIMSKIRGKEEWINEYCRRNNLRKGICIVIHGTAMNLPQMFLPSDVVSFWGKLGVDIGFDMYVY